MTFSLKLIVRYPVGFWVLLFGLATTASPQEATLDLEACIRYGLDHNLALQNALSDAVIAGEEIIVSEGQYDPVLELSGIHVDSELPSSTVLIGAGTEQTGAEGRLAKSFASGTTIGLESSLSKFSFDSMAGVDPAGMSFGGSSDPVSSFSVALTLDQSLWRNAWGKTSRARVRMSRMGFEAATYTYDRQRESVAATIIDSYWSAYAARRFYEVNLDALERARDLLEINKAKFEDGLLDETDILAAEASLATIEVDVLDRKSQALNAADAIKELISLPRDEWDNTEILFHDAERLAHVSSEIHFLDAYEMALSNRLDVVALAKARERALEQVLVAEQGSKPDLRLQGSYGRGDTGVDYDDSIGFEKSAWSVGLAIVIPWFDGAEKSVLRQAELALGQIDNQIEALERSIDLACRVAVRRLAAARERVAASRRAWALQERKLEAEKEKLSQGRSATQVVIDYQDDLSFAEWNHVLSVSDFHRAMANYHLVRGTLFKEKWW